MIAGWRVNPSRMYGKGTHEGSSFRLGAPARHPSHKGEA